MRPRRPAPWPRQPPRRCGGCFQTDLDGVRKLFQIQGADFAMLKVQAVVFRSNDDWDLKETLWERSEP